MAINKNLVYYHSLEDLSVLSLNDNFNFLKQKNGLVYNLGDAFFYPPNYLKNNLSFALVFSENSMKRDIPSGSVWHFKEDKYRQEILKDDVGCGMSLFLTPKDIPADDWMGVLRNKSIGGGNHFLNTGSFDDEVDYMLLHADLNKEGSVPKTIDEAKDFVHIASQRRQELAYDIFQELGVNGYIFKDWPHNSVDEDEFGVSYLKGVVDSKKTGGVGLIGLNPHDGAFLTMQLSNKLNGYMQHGLGVKNHEFKKFYQKDSIDSNMQYIVKENSCEDVCNSFNSVSSLLQRFCPESFYVDRQLKPDLTFKLR